MEILNDAVSPNVLKKSAVPTVVWGSSDSFTPINPTTATTTTLLHSHKYLAAVNATTTTTSDDSSKTRTWNPACTSLREDTTIHSDWANTGLFTEVIGNIGGAPSSSPLPFRVTTVINPFDASITLSLLTTTKNNNKLDDTIGDNYVENESLLAHHTWCFDTKHREDIKKASDELLNHSKPSPSGNGHNQSNSVVGAEVSADPYAGDEDEYEEYDARGNMVVVKKPAGGSSTKGAIGGVQGGGGIGLDDGVFIMAKHKAAISRVFPVKSEIVLTVIKDATLDDAQKNTTTITNASNDSPATEEQLASPPGKLLSNPANLEFKSDRSSDLGLLEACHTRRLVVIKGTQISQMRSGTLLIIPFTIHCTTTTTRDNLDKCTHIRPSGACQWLRAGQEQLVSAPFTIPQPASPATKKDHIHDFSVVVCDNGCVISQHQDDDKCITSTPPKADLGVTQCFQLLTLSQREMGLCMWELKGHRGADGGEGSSSALVNSMNNDVFELRLLSKAESIRSLPNSNYNTAPSQERTGSLTVVSDTPTSLETRIYEVDSLTIAQQFVTNAAAATTTNPKGKNKKGGKRKQAKQSAPTTKKTILAHRRTIQLASMAFGSSASGSVTFVGATTVTKTPVTLHRLVKEVTLAIDETTTSASSSSTTIVFEPLSVYSDVYKAMPETSSVGKSILSPHPTSVEESLDTICRFPGSRPIFVAVVHKRGTVELVSVLEHNASHKKPQKVESKILGGADSTSSHQQEAALATTLPKRRWSYGLTCVKEVLLGKKVTSVSRALPDELPMEYKQYISAKEAKEGKSYTKAVSTSTITTTFRNLVVSLSPDSNEGKDANETTLLPKSEAGGGGLGGGDFWSQLRQDIQSTSTERQPINEVFSSDITRGNQKKQQQPTQNNISDETMLAIKSPNNTSTSLPSSIHSLLVSPSASASSKTPAVISSTTVQDKQEGTVHGNEDVIVVSFQEKPLWDDINNPKYEVSTYRLNDNKNAKPQRKIQKENNVDANPLNTFMETMSCRDEKKITPTAKLHADDCSLLGSLTLNQQQGLQTLCWNWSQTMTEQQQPTGTPFKPVEVLLKDVFPADKCSSIIVLDVRTKIHAIEKIDGTSATRVVVAITLGCLSNELNNSKLFRRMVKGINETNSVSFQTFTLVSEVATIEVPVEGVTVVHTTEISTPLPVESLVVPSTIEPTPKPFELTTVENVKTEVKKETECDTPTVEGTPPKVNVTDNQVDEEPPRTHESTIDEITKTGSEEEEAVVPRRSPVKTPIGVEMVQEEGGCGITLLEMEQLMRESCRKHRDEILTKLDVQFSQMERRIVSRVTSHLW